MNRRNAVAVGLLMAGLLAGAGFMSAQEKAKEAAPVRPNDEAAVRAASQALAAAFTKGDAKAVAACWTEEGEYIEERGPTIRGRAALEKAYADFFAKRSGVTTDVKTDRIRFVGADTAIEEGTFTVKAKNSPDHSSRFSSLYARQGGRWLVAVLKEWGDEETDRPSLDNLAWIIGTWETEGEAQAKTTYAWSINKKFITCNYSVTAKKGDAPSVGTQVIGVNPATGLIHSWTFDSDGGIGEASWTFDGERWVIESTGVLSNGASSTATNFLTRSTDEAFTWRSVQRTIDGQSQPDIPAIKVKRTAK